MNIGDIETFLTIVETQSIYKAAEVLFLSQSTISRRLKSLENELNFALMDRSKGHRTIQLTPKGEQFISIAQKWMAIYKETQQIQNADTRIQLSVGCTEWFNAYIFLPFYQDLLKKEKQLNMTIKSGPSFTVYSLLNNMEIDIGFVVRHMPFKNIKTTPLFRDPMVLVCSRKAKLPDTPINPDELDPFYEVEWNHLPEYRLWHERWWNPKIIPHVTGDFSVPLCFGFLEDPNFWIIVPLSVAKHFTKEMELSIHEFTVPPPDLICYCIEHRFPKPSNSFGLKIFNQYLSRFLEDLIRTTPMVRYELSE